MNTSLLRKRALQAGVAVPALALMSAAFATPAFAQDNSAAAPQTCDKSKNPNCPPEPETPGNTIVVTGSILQRTDTETASPVTAITSAQLEQRGINTVSEGLNRMAANGSGTLSEGWNNGDNFAVGANAVSLRGLTVQNTLTVFDGLRQAPYPLADDGHRNFVDISAVPDFVLDKVEVLKDSASSTYGADAVAGVVNLIMKKQITGIHLNMSGGLTQEGDGAEIRGDFSAGYGDLEEKGFNVYIAGTYRKNDVIWARDRGFPFNTGNYTSICESGVSAAAGGCMTVNPYFYEFGLTGTGALAGSTVPTAPVIAPANSTNGRTGPYQLLNPDCAAFGAFPLNLPNSARGFNAAGVPTWPSTVCAKDTMADYITVRPDVERYGFAAKATVKLGDRAEAYLFGSYMHVDTYAQVFPRGYVDATTAPQAITVNPVILPVYVCAAGTGSFVQPTPTTAYNVSNGCQTYNAATNTYTPTAGAILNPNNPFAASGRQASLRAHYPDATTDEGVTRTLRGEAGLQGTLGANDEWHYNFEFTASEVQLTRTQKNFPIPERLATVIAQGTWNFAQPWLNSQDLRDYVAPDNVKVASSQLWEASAIVSRNLFTLPGGPLQVAAGAQYRNESINNPSAAPANLFDPFSRPYGINSAGAVGSRNVWSVFYEVGAPILDMLELNASGRYDNYSSGQTNFSPKFTATFKPIRQVMVRGTWSKGFRIPSFNEAYGLPTTGYTTLKVDCVAFAAWCASHGNNQYATASYQLGRTATGNPALDPERSTSWTAGVVLEPLRNLSFTVDYFDITVKDMIGNIAAGDQTKALAAYFNTGATAGVVPGVNIIPAAFDPQFPNAVPLPRFIEFSYQNADSEHVSGIDFGMKFRHNFGPLRFNSDLDASYLLDYKVTRKSGAVEDYEGTLSPCDYTSCSGSPQLRFVWANTLGYGPLDLTVTTYYTEGYDEASIDYGGVKGDCAASVGASVNTYENGDPVQCIGKETWNADLTLNYEINDNASVYLNVLDFLDIKPPFDPSATYSLFLYNVAWAEPNMIGRSFRIGAKVDF